MLLYCDNTKTNTDDKIVSEIKKDSELYSYLSILFTGLNHKKDCCSIEEIPYVLIYLKNSDETEYLCRHYKYTKGPVMMYEETLKAFQKDRRALSLHIHHLHYVQYEIYKVCLDRLVLDTIMYYDVDNERDIYFNQSDDSIISIFDSFFRNENEFQISFFCYDEGYDFDFEKQNMTFFYDYNDNKTETFEFYSPGVLNRDLFFKEPGKNIEKYKYLDAKEKYLDRRESYIKHEINNNNEYNNQKQLKNDQLKKEIIEFLSILKRRETELSEQEIQLMKYEETLANEEKALLDEEKELLNEKREFQTRKLRCDTRIEMEEKNLLEIETKLLQRKNDFDELDRKLKLKQDQLKSFIETFK